MAKRRGLDIMTLIIVSIVTVLIWLLAEARTRQSEVIPATIALSVPGNGDFIVSPQQIGVDIRVEGGVEAIRRTRKLMTSSTLPVSITAQAGRQTLDDLTSLIETLDIVQEAGANIVSTEPPSISVEVEELVTRTARVRAVLPTASTVEDVSVAEDAVTITLPQIDSRRLPDPLVVEAVVDQREVARLEPGVLHTVAGTIRLPSSVGTFGSVTFDPPTVKVSFRLVSRVRTFELERVRIQINSAPEDFGQYLVNLPEQFLRSVSVEADADVVARLERGEGQVVAVVYLSTNDKERRLETKPVAYFTALFPDGLGAPVTATVNGDPHPEVELQIRPLVDPSE